MIHRLHAQRKSRFNLNVSLHFFMHTIWHWVNRRRFLSVDVRTHKPFSPKVFQPNNPLPNVCCSFHAVYGLPPQKPLFSFHYHSYAFRAHMCLYSTCKRVVSYSRSQALSHTFFAFARKSTFHCSRFIGSPDITDKLTLLNLMS
jgi:hypothetical protein